MSYWDHEHHVSSWTALKAGVAFTLGSAVAAAIVAGVVVGVVVIADEVAS